MYAEYTRPQFTFLALVPWQYPVFDQLCSVQDVAFFLGFKGFNSDYSSMFSISKTTQVTIEERPLLYKLKPFISNSCLIRQSFSGNRCESSITISAWIVIWNYAYSPFEDTGYSSQTQSLQPYRLKRKYVKIWSVDVTKYLFWNGKGVH